MQTDGGAASFPSGRARSTVDHHLESRGPDGTV